MISHTSAQEMPPGVAAMGTGQSCSMLCSRLWLLQCVYSVSVTLSDADRHHPMCMSGSYLSRTVTKHIHFNVWHDNHFSEIFTKWHISKKGFFKLSPIKQHSSSSCRQFDASRNTLPIPFLEFTEFKASHLITNCPFNFSCKILQILTFPPVKLSSSLFADSPSTDSDHCPVHCELGTSNVFFGFPLCRHCKNTLLSKCILKPEGKPSHPDCQGADLAIRK